MVFNKIPLLPARSLKWHLLSGPPKQCQCFPGSWDEEAYTCDACIEEEEEREREEMEDQESEEE